MSTNYQRIPKSSEIRVKYLELVENINSLDIWCPNNIKNEFKHIEKGFERWSVWDEFTDGLSIHLGQRASGWKFCWNFHDNKYYTNKEELLEFIRSGRVIDEYGELQDTEEFIKMALEWSQPDGKVLNKDYYDIEERDSKHIYSFNMTPYYDKIIDGLRVSNSTEFS
jgi:hypothetical protein